MGKAEQRLFMMIHAPHMDFIVNVVSQKTV